MSKDEKEDMHRRMEHDKEAQAIDEDEMDPDTADDLADAERATALMEPLNETLAGSEIDDQYQQQSDENKLTNDYYVWPTPTQPMAVTKASLENDPDVKNHIVVCGIHSAIKSFIMPLRAKYMKEFQLQIIVIITGEPEEKEDREHLDTKIWDTISRFKFVYLVNGSPLK